MAADKESQASVAEERTAEMAEDPHPQQRHHGLMAGMAAVGRMVGHGAMGIWRAVWGPQRGQASYYGTSRRGDHHGDGFAWQKMANGEPMNPNALTAAHKSLPLGTRVRVTHGGASVDVVIADRGPYAKGRILDLSPRAAEELGIKEAGHGEVELEVLSLPAG